MLARWSGETAWWYPAVVCSVTSEGIEVQFDDGDREYVGLNEARLLKLKAGMRVQCRWQGGDGFYQGVIREITGSALHIDYDDGDKEVTSASMIRVELNDL